MDEPTIHLYAVLLGSSALCSLVAAQQAWARRAAPGGLALTAFLASACFWSATYGIFWLTADPVWKVIWLNLTYVGATVGPVAYLLYALRHVHLDHWLTPGRVRWLLAEPVLINLALWTDPWHHGFFAGLRQPETSMFYDGGILFWFNIAFAYAVLLVATVLLIGGAVRSPRLYRWQALLLSGSVLLPWLANLLTFAGLTPWPGLDATPLAFTLMGLVVLYDLLGWQLLDVMPVARGALIDQMPDGVLVLDQQRRIVDLNPTARRLAARAGSLQIGQELAPESVRWPELAQAVLADPGATVMHQELRLEETYLDLRIQALRGPGGLDLGRLISWHDITAQKEAELALQEAVDQLQRRVTEVESLHALLREQAVRDGLTGVYNRRYLDESIDRELSRARREGSLLAIVILDADHFKQVNDQYGHNVGDETLKRIAAWAAQHARASDMVCRYGGEEFAVVMPGVDGETAFRRVEAWRQAIGAMEFQAGTRGFRMTLSGGIAVFPVHARTARDLFRVADAALYAAKRDGRNRIVVGPPADSPLI